MNIEQAKKELQWARDELVEVEARIDTARKSALKCTIPVAREIAMCAVDRQVDAKVILQRRIQELELIIAGLMIQEEEPDLTVGMDMGEGNSSTAVVDIEIDDNGRIKRLAISEWAKLHVKHDMECTCGEGEACSSCKTSGAHHDLLNPKGNDVYAMNAARLCGGESFPYYPPENDNKSAVIQEEELSESSVKVWNEYQKRLSELFCAEKHPLFNCGPSECGCQECKVTHNESSVDKHAEHLQAPDFVEGNKNSNIIKPSGLPVGTESVTSRFVVVEGSLTGNESMTHSVIDSHEKTGYDIERMICECPSKEFADDIASSLNNCMM